MVWVPTAWLSACFLAADPGRVSSHSGISSAQFSSGDFSGDSCRAASMVKWFIALAMALSMLAWSTGLRSAS